RWHPPRSVPDARSTDCGRVPRCSRPPTCNRSAGWRRRSHWRSSSIKRARACEWEAARVHRPVREQQRTEAAQVLPSEPHFHPWCAAASPFDETVLRAVDEAIGADEAQRPGLSDTARDAARISRGEAAELIGRARHGDYEAMTRLVEGQRATV